MPELPEVETVVRQLRSNLSGAVIAEVRVRLRKIVRTDPEAFRRGLLGRSIDQVDREGKRILLRLTPRGCLAIHLGMTGRLMIRPAGSPLDRHTQVCWKLGGGSRELRFVDPRQFGGVWFLPGGGDPAEYGLRPLGPDALTLRWSQFQEVLRRSRQIKALLLDQQAIAGLGNIYCDEALYAAGIHPHHRADLLREPQAVRLFHAIRGVLRASIAAGGTTISDYRTADGKEGSFQRKLKVYGREGEPCGRCGSVIQRILAAGRSSHLCPRCQPRRRSARPRRR